MALTKAQLRIVGSLIGNVRSECCIVPNGQVHYSGAVSTKFVKELERNGLVETKESSLGFGTATAGWKTFGYVILSDQDLSMIIAALRHTGNIFNGALADKMQVELDSRKKA